MLKHTVDFVYIHQRKVKSITSIIRDPNLIRTDNGEIEPINRSPDSPNPPATQQIQETEHQRQTIIPTVHLDSLLNHNHHEIDKEDDGDYHRNFSTHFHSSSFRSAKSLTNR